jgi:hypothetical protein
MAKVITFSRFFPKNHPKAGQPTHFVEKFVQSIKEQGYELPYIKSFPLAFLESLSTDQFIPKHHTIRGGNRWKVGDKFSPRVWSGKPYASPQIIIGPDITIQDCWDITINDTGLFFNSSVDSKIDPFRYSIETIAGHDGLSYDEFKSWFAIPFKGQIICWKKGLYHE